MKCQVCLTQLWWLVQAEGGFVYALGMLLQEDVTYDAKGQPEFDSTWNYKIPSAACVPREIIIRMLEVNPQHMAQVLPEPLGKTCMCFVAHSIVHVPL